MTSQPSEEVQSPEAMLRDIALHLQRSGHSMSDAKRLFVENGLPAAIASNIVNGVAIENAEQRRSGARNIKLGSIATVVGTALTASSYSAAEPGGAYTLFWGAIAFGLLWLVVGLLQYKLPRQRWEVLDVPPAYQQQRQTYRSPAERAAEDMNRWDNFQ